MAGALHNSFEKDGSERNCFDVHSFDFLHNCDDARVEVDLLWRLDVEPQFTPAIAKRTGQGLKLRLRHDVIGKIAIVTGQGRLNNERDPRVIEG